MGWALADEHWTYRTERSDSTAPSMKASDAYLTIDGEHCEPIDEVSWTVDHSTRSLVDLRSNMPGTMLESEPTVTIDVAVKDHEPYLDYMTETVSVWVTRADGWEVLDVDRVTMYDLSPGELRIDGIGAETRMEREYTHPRQALTEGPHTGAQSALSGPGAGPIIDTSNYTNAQEAPPDAEDGPDRFYGSSKIEEAYDAIKHMQSSQLIDPTLYATYE